MQSGQLLLIVAALVAIAAVGVLIRFRKLRESYSIVILGSILLFVVMATWGFGSMIWLTHRLGVTYAPSGVFTLGFGVVAAVGVYLGVVVTSLQSKIKTLGQENALLEARLRRIESETDRTSGGSGANAA
jgi:Na+/H+ antiporter NhaA